MNRTCEEREWRFDLRERRPRMWVAHDLPRAYACAVWYGAHHGRVVTTTTAAWRGVGRMFSVWSTYTTIHSIVVVYTILTLSRMANTR